MKISIVINNFNYARFLPAAIDSAIGQTHADTEVIVVDDGSTDHSRDIIRAYGPKLRAVFQSNEGQAAAFASGFAAASGDVILFLDADDALHPQAAASVAKAWTQQTSVVQFCLETIDGLGRASGSIYPPLPKRWSAADIRATVLRSGFYPSPPTTGNAFGRAFLAAVLPLPTTLFRVGADGPLAAVAPLYGEVIVLREALGFYRIHGKNNGALESVTSERFAYYVELDLRRAAILFSHADRLKVALRRDILDRAFFHLQYRLASRKLRPDLHPVANDRPLRLAAALTRAAFVAPDRPLLRVLVGLWGWLVAVAPRSMAQQLIELRFVGGSRPRVIDRTLAMLGLVRRRPTIRKPLAAAVRPAPVE